MKVVLTGAPCTGKSAVFEALEGPGFGIPGFQMVPEVARWWLKFMDKHELQHYKNDKEFFQRLIEINHITNYSYFPEGKSAIFDRSLPDEIAYRDFFNMPVPDTLTNDCKRFSVDMVFLFPYWEEIYKTDSERIETKEQAKQLDQLIMDAYADLGYDVIVVPKVSIQERVDYIKSKILFYQTYRK